MISATGYRGQHSKRVHAQGVSEWLKGGGLVWVDIIDGTDEELQEIEVEFGLHPLAIEDVREQSQRPKIEHYDNHAFIVLYGIDREALGQVRDIVEEPAGAAPAGHRDHAQRYDYARDQPEMHVFVGPGWVITLRFRNQAGRAIDVGPIRDQFERSRGENCSAGLLLHNILDVVVDSYFDVADLLDDEIEAIEDGLVVELRAADGSPSPLGEVQHRLLDVRRSIVVFRRHVVPTREVLLTLLRREVHWIDDETTRYLEDVLDHLLRVVDQLDSQRELVGNAFDAYLAVVSNRSNEIMKKMTSWGAILLGSTLIAGIYGMNFEDMPELGNTFGYPGALGAMLVLTLFLHRLFRKKGWL